MASLDTHQACHNCPCEMLGDGPGLPSGLQALCQSGHPAPVAGADRLLGSALQRSCGRSSRPFHSVSARGITPGCSGTHSDPGRTRIRSDGFVPTAAVRPSRPRTRCRSWNSQTTGPPSRTARHAMRTCIRHPHKLGPDGIRNGYLEQGRYQRIAATPGRTAQRAGRHRLAVCSASRKTRGTHPVEHRRAWQPGPRGGRRQWQTGPCRGGC